MTRILIFILSTIVLTSCNEQTRPTETKKTRPYFGDSLIKLSFTQKNDTTCSADLNSKLFIQSISYGQSGDTTIADICTNLISGVYNGAVEMNVDTLILNYWLDSSDCLPTIVQSRLSYKIVGVKMKNDFIAAKFIKTNSPLRKRCK